MNSRRALCLLALAALSAARGFGAQTAPAPAAPAGTNPPGIVTVPNPKRGEVVAPVVRERLLASAARYLNRANLALAEELAQSANPFFPPPPPPPVAPTGTVVAVPVPGGGPPPPPPPPQLTDEERLAQAAEALVPDGMFILGERSILKFPGNRLWRSGESIAITFPGDSAPSEIVLQTVTQFDFTIKLNEATLKVPIQRPRSSGSSAPPALAPAPATP